MLASCSTQAILARLAQLQAVHEDSQTRSGGKYMFRSVTGLLFVRDLHANRHNV